MEGWNGGRMGPQSSISFPSIFSFTGSLAVAPGLIFVNPPHPFEEFLGIGSTDFLAFRSVAIIITVAGTDGLCVSLLAFQLRDKFVCHFMPPF